MVEINTLRVIRSTATHLTVHWADGAEADFASLWLLDNRPEDRDPHSGQRLVDIADLPAHPRILEAGIHDGEIVVRWTDGLPPTTFDANWLRRQTVTGAVHRPQMHPRHWLDGSRMDGRQAFAWAPLARFDAEPSLRLRWLTRLIEDGIAFLSEVPCNEGAILSAVGGIGLVAETNYGLLFDVRAVAKPENLAYSDLGLGLHTDNPYRDPVPGYQVLHALVASPDGGESLFADGFALAEHLRVTEPAAFDRLTRTMVPFHYRSADAELYSEKPLLELAADGRLRAVHYNSRSIAPLNASGVAVEPFYAAYRLFARMLREPRFQVRMKLGDGDMVVFDNRRALHGRTAFSSQRHPRHLQGCYLTRDSVLSRAGVLGRSVA